MKKGIVSVFFLLIFSQCNNNEKILSSFPPGIGQINMVPANRNNLSTSSGYQVSRASHTKTDKSGETRRKRKNVRRIHHDQPTSKLFRTNSDSLFIRRLNYLRSHRIDLDLNEPVSKKYLLSAIENQKFPSLITRSNESFLQINFDNDIIDYTDRFYTNGIRIDWITPGMQMNPLNFCMIPYWRSGQNYYGISLVQNMYTPSTTKIGGILYGDRPYAAYLFFGSFKITNDAVHNFRQTSELDLGIIGPNSYGEWVQRSFHNSIPTNNEPLGWEYQIKNDVVLNYSHGFEKGLFNSNNID